VLIYRSRARGDFRPGSDIDLAMLAPTMEPLEFSKLWTALDDLPIIFRLDVSLHHEVADQQLKHNMLANGVTLYQAGPSSPTSPPPLPA
jgi:proline iminopeptidase